jgi:hypothetical protein
MFIKKLAFPVGFEPTLFTLTGCGLTSYSTTGTWSRFFTKVSQNDNYVENLLFEHRVGFEPT